MFHFPSWPFGPRYCQGSVPHRTLAALFALPFSGYSCNLSIYSSIGVTAKCLVIRSAGFETPCTFRNSTAFCSSFCCTHNMLVSNGEVAHSPFERQFPMLHSRRQILVFVKSYLCLSLVKLSQYLHTWLSLMLSAPPQRRIVQLWLVSWTRYECSVTLSLLLLLTSTCDFYDNRPSHCQSIYIWSCPLSAI